MSNAEGTQPADVYRWDFHDSSLIGEEEGTCIASVNVPLGAFELMLKGQRSTRWSHLVIHLDAMPFAVVSHNREATSDEKVIVFEACVDKLPESLGGNSPQKLELGILDETAKDFESNFIGTTFEDAQRWATAQLARPGVGAAMTYSWNDDDQVYCWVRGPGETLAQIIQAPSVPKF